MPAPVPDSPSISSSGYTDGLGRREIAFDRETGTLLERLYVRPEIGVFEAAISARVDRLQSFEDERFARPIAVERAGGHVTVISEYVAGIRMGDLLEMPDALQDAPTLDLALAFLLEALPALGTFHETIGAPHGLISTGRTVLTLSPKVVFLDASFGDVVGRLHYSRSRLWDNFGLAMPPSAGPSRFNVSSDIGQVALTALMLVLGRAIRDDEYPHGVSELVSEVADVALIRGSDAFATGLQQFLRRALPLSAQSPYRTAEDAAADVRQVTNLEMGTEACSRALTAFIEQIGVGAQPLPAATMAARPSLQVVGFEEEAAIDLLGAETVETDEITDAGEEVAFEQEIVIEGEEEPAAFDLSLTSSAEESIDTVTSADSYSYEAEPVAEAPVETFAEESYREPALEASTSTADYKTVDKTVEDPFTYRRGATYEAPKYDETPAISERVRIDEPAPAAQDSYSDFFKDPAPIAAAPAEAKPIAHEDVAHQDEEEAEAEPARTSFFSPRRKRDEKSRSARARKDKLRSAAAAFKESVLSRVKPEAPAPVKPRAAEPPAEPVHPPPPPKPALPPMIPAHRASAFEPPIPEPASGPLPRPFTSPPPVSAPFPMPAAPAAVTPPVPFSSPTPMPVFNSQPIQVAPSTSAAVQPLAPIQLQGGGSGPAIPLSPSTPALKLKAPISIAQSSKRERFDPPPPADAPYYPRPAQDSGSREFPWKLAAAAVVIILVGVVAGRAYLPDPKVEQERAAAKAAEIAAAAKLPPAKRGPAPVPSGRIVITTEPPGARVLLDAIQVGETPLTLDSVPAGKHTITLISSHGAVEKKVTVETGRTHPLDVRLFSGWVAIFAPITFEVSEKGRLIGNTEHGNLLLPPGRHELTLTNKDLDYSAVHTVDIVPGEVRPLTVEPKGKATFNASPWAEVWVEGKKIGETPLAYELPLGVHNVVFKHPDLGERSATVTIKANQTAPISVDFNR